MLRSKKRGLILASFLVLVCLVLTGCNSGNTMSDFDKYFNSKDKKVIYYASTTCAWCSLQTPVLETIAEDYNIDYLYVDNSKLSRKQSSQIQKKLGIEGGTPQTVIVQNGKTIDVASGYTDPRDYINFFKDNGIVPQDAVYSKENNLTFINYSEYEKLITENKTHVIVVGQTTCSHCIAIKPTLNEIAGENKLTINYLNLTEMTQEEFNKFDASLKKINYNDPDYIEKGSFGTPLILVVKNGKISSYIAGERSKSQLLREFRKSGLISE